MNKFFKASLLAIVFVGMSSFSTIILQKESADTCEEAATALYEDVQANAPGALQETLNDVWFSSYWHCIDYGGASDFTADLNK
jgi:hypothetical protein